MVENVAPKQVWEALVSQAHGQLVDVRTDVEWAQIGVPDLEQRLHAAIEAELAGDEATS